MPGRRLQLHLCSADESRLWRSTLRREGLDIVIDWRDAEQVLGRRVALVDKKTGAGSLFGIVLNPAANGIYYVDDGDNTLKLLH